MRLLHRPLLIGVLHVVNHPLRVLAVAGLALAACIGAAMWKLDIATDQNRLFDPNVQFFRDYLNFTEQFPENEAIYVIIESADTKPIAVERWTDIADRIANKLASMPKYVSSVDAKVPTEKLGAQGLLFDDPKLVQKNFEETRRFIPLVKFWAEKPAFLVRFIGASPLERFLAGIKTQKPDTEMAGFIAMLARSWNQVVTHPDQ